jgi:hypothetical protein
MRNIEIQQIAQLKAAETQVTQELTTVDLQGRFDGFDLNDDEVIHQQIDAIGVIDEETAISEWD